MLINRKRRSPSEKLFGKSTLARELSMKMPKYLIHRVRYSAILRWKRLDGIWSKVLQTVSKKLMMSWSSSWPLNQTAPMYLIQSTINSIAKRTETYVSSVLKIRTMLDSILYPQCTEPTCQSPWNPIGVTMLFCSALIVWAMVWSSKTSSRGS